MLKGHSQLKQSIEGRVRNKDIHKTIAREIEAAGYAKTGGQCKKIEIGIQEDNKRGKTSTGRKNWNFCDAMDSVLGHKPVTQPPVMVKSGATSSCITDEYIGR